MLRRFFGILPLALAALALSCGAPATWSGFPWVEDDYATALATAKERKLPIFVESWAPW